MAVKSERREPPRTLTELALWCLGSTSPREAWKSALMPVRSDEKTVWNVAGRSELMYCRLLVNVMRSSIRVERAKS